MNARRRPGSATGQRYRRRTPRPRPPRLLGARDVGALHPIPGGPAVVIVTGLDDTRLAKAALRLGAQDYLVKDEATPGTLARTIHYAVQRHRALARLDSARRDQLAEKDRFLSHVSHELRTPLAVVHQFVSLVADGLAGPVTPSQRDYLDVAVRNIDQLKVMIDDLLDVGRLEGDRLAFHCVPVALGPLLRDTTRGFDHVAREADVELTTALRVGPTVECDPARVRQVVTNLLDNALRSTPRKGRVRVEMRTADDEVRVTVRDTGRGISVASLDKVFERFFQEPRDDESSREGLGLGLFVCRQLVERQGGHIWAESAPGAGTAVTFTLPATPGRTARSTT